MALQVTCWLLVLPGAPQAKTNSSVLLLGDLPGYNLTPHLEKLEYSESSLDFAQILKPTWQKQFHPLNKKAFYAPSQELKEHWFRFTLKSNQQKKSAALWLLSLDYVYLAQIDLYTPTSQGWRVVKTGLELPFETREIPYRGFVFRIPLGGGQATTCYMRVITKGLKAIRFKMETLSQFTRRVLQEDRFLSICLGVLVGMILFNIFLAISLRDRVYLYYVGYIFFALMSMIFLYGEISTWCDLGLDRFVNLLWINFGLFTTFAYLFMRGALSTKKLAPLLDKVLIWGGFYGFAIVIAGVLGITWIGRWLTLGSGMFSPWIALVAGTISLRRGYTPARYFLLAWGTLAVAVGVAFLWEIGTLDEYFWAQNALLVGIASESILLSLGLAERIRKLKQESETLAQSEKHLKKLSYTDELTGLFNKRFFSYRLKEYLSDRFLPDQALSLLFMDLDDFKKLNDTWGHALGDEVLRSLAQAITENVRANDLPCRWGGEEFAVILPGVALEPAAAIGERIRKRFAEKVILYEGQSIKKSVSLGLGQARPGEDLESLVHRVDQALYQAKKAGKNQLCLSERV